MAGKDCCRLPATAFRFSGALEHRTDTGYDGFGQPDHAWSEKAPVNAMVETLRGRELEQARQLFAKAEHRVVIRHRKGVTTRMRFKFGDRVFYIGHVDDFDPRRDIATLCSEAAPTS